MRGQVSGHRQRRGRHRGARALTCQGTSHGDEVRSEAGRVRSVRPQTSGAGEWATGHLRATPNPCHSARIVRTRCVPPRGFLIDV
jgi:hypothetical protein